MQHKISYILFFGFVLSLISGCKKTDDWADTAKSSTANDTIILEVNYVRPDYAECTGPNPYKIFVYESPNGPKLKYKWSTGDTTNMIIANVPGNYSVKVTWPGGSQDYQVNLEKCEQTLYIPKAFTPNADGMNDYFIAKSRYRTLVQFQMWIYDQSGNLLFDTGKTKNPESSIPWNGKDKNGISLPRGYYLYLIKCVYWDGTEKKYTGSVQIIST